MNKGIGVSSGIGIAPVFLFERTEPAVDGSPAQDRAAERTRFEDALSAVIAQTEQLYDNALRNMGQEEANIFEAHRMLLEDPEMIDPIRQAIDGGDNAAFAISQTMSSVIEMFENMDDDYMRERAADMKDLRDRLLRAVLGISERDISRLPGMVILAAHDLTPSDTARMDKAHVAGILTEVGGRTSHSAIMARAMGVPAVVGCAGILSQLREGQRVAIDGEAGTVEIEPSPERLCELSALADAFCRPQGGSQNLAEP